MSLLLSENRNSFIKCNIFAIVNPMPSLFRHVLTQPLTPVVNSYLCHTGFTWLWFHPLNQFLAAPATQRAELLCIGGLCHYTKHMDFISCHAQIDKGCCIFFLMWKGKKFHFLTWLFLLQKTRCYFMASKCL